MTWRKYETHKEETRAVMAALKAAGINAVVGHGKGTAWGHLKINIGDGQGLGEHTLNADGSHFTRAICPLCQQLSELRQQVLKIAQEVTGRTGGRIIVFTQDHWDKKLNKSVPIIQLPLGAKGVRRC